MVSDRKTTGYGQGSTRGMIADERGGGQGWLFHEDRNFLRQDLDLAHQCTTRRSCGLFSSSLVVFLFLSFFFFFWRGGEGLCYSFDFGGSGMSPAFPGMMKVAKREGDTREDEKEKSHTNSIQWKRNPSSKGEGRFRK